MPLLTATNLTIACPPASAEHNYGKASCSDVLLQNTSLTLESGITALLGPSGCGKSTLLRALAGLYPVTTGTIAIDGKDITTRSTAKRHIGLVFQDFALFPNMTVLQNVLFGMKKTGLFKHAAKQRQHAADLLAMVDLQDKATAYPDMLSGGQRQRVALVRALAAQPKFLLLDEPFSGLDPATRTSVRAQTVALLQEQNIPTLLVTHDEQEAFTTADQLLRLENGKLLQVKSPQQQGNRVHNSIDNLVPFSRVIANQHKVAAALV